MTIDFRQLQYVIAAAHAGSFRRAARVLDLPESTISRRIRDLEDELGVALFIRSHNGVYLTQAGNQFLPGARKAIEQIKHTVTNVGAFGRGENGSVRIGIFTSLASGFLSELVRAYISAHPSVRLEVVEGGPAHHIASLQRFQLDVAFLTGEPVADDCDRAHLWNEGVYVALPADDELTAVREITWSMLKDRKLIVMEADPGPEIYDYLMKHLAELGHHPEVEQHAVGRENLMNLVAMGRGLTVTSEATIGVQYPSVVYRKLATDFLPFSAIWSARNDNPALRRLLSLARGLSRRWPRDIDRAAQASRSL
ncbi:MULTISPECIES: LysR family transcriptional regulator [unclassified Bradyrhizobium]|uniref:LysR family transcriptional regulator n=1 Tax=unclassified Bradyrhizobium TaxID=2631580 RepID=UPI00070B80C1|nr:MULTISPECIES: LysR family transcriptional regulator [unclassified Bradyrhizobium]KQT27401.1 LysR family transcriptional regulator [Bradyrhizobium sp. Leaf396]